MTYIYGDARVCETVKNGNGIGKGTPPLPTLKKEFSKVVWISAHTGAKLYIFYLQYFVLVRTQRPSEEVSLYHYRSLPTRTLMYRRRYKSLKMAIFRLSTASTT